MIYMNVTEVNLEITRLKSAMERANANALDGGMALLTAVSKFKGIVKKRKKKGRRHRRSTVNKTELVGGGGSRMHRKKTKMNVLAGAHGGKPAPKRMRRKSTRQQMMAAIEEDAEDGDGGSFNAPSASRRPTTDREALEKLYTRVDPAKLANIDAILKNFEKNRERTIALIEAKYPNECEWPAVNNMAEHGVTDDMFDML